jgi:hypothetical protein
VAEAPNIVPGRLHPFDGVCMRAGDRLSSVDESGMLRSLIAWQTAVAMIESASTIRRMPANAAEWI